MKLIIPEQNILSKHMMLLIFAAFIALWACAKIYYSGASNTIFLDTVHNLDPLRSLPTLNFVDAIPFIFGNESGPLGRPASMYTFWLDYVMGNSAGENLRQTNIFIHLLISIFLMIFAHQVIKPFESYTNQSAIIGVLCGLVWAFHPENTSTVQYIVQRMTQLSALFSIISLVSYMHGRALIESDLKRGLLFLSLAFFPFAFIAVFSKENALLLILIFFILEKTICQNIKYPQVFRRLFLIFVVGPLLLLVVGFVFSIPGFIEDYQYRSFNMLERLLTQLRVLALQLNHIFLPDIREFSLYHERMEYSTSLISPITTALSLALHSALIWVAVKYRGTLPVLAFSIFWFYGWHLIESTIVPLELHFEHRNYLPMMGPILGVVYYVSSWIYATRSVLLRNVGSMTLCVWLVSLSFLTLQLNTLWAKPGELSYHWYTVNSKSSRAKFQMAFVYSQLGRHDEAIEVLLEGLNQYPGEITLALEAWNYACEFGVELPFTLDELAASKEIVYQGDSVSHQFQAMRRNVLSGKCEFVSEKVFDELLSRIEEFQIDPVVKSSVYFDSSGIYLVFGNTEKAYSLLEKAYELNPSPFVITQHALLAMFIEDYNSAIRIIDFGLNEIASRGWYAGNLARNLEQIRELALKQLAARNSATVNLRASGL